MRPFLVSSENNIFCFYLELETGDHTIFRSALFIHGSSLLEYPKYVPSDTPPDNPHLIPWSEWGPRNTRWIPFISLGSHECYTYGNRVVHGLRKLINGRPSQHLRILDFNPYNVRRIEDDTYDDPSNLVLDEGATHISNHLLQEDGDTATWVVELDIEGIPIPVRLGGDWNSDEVDSDVEGSDGEEVVTLTIDIGPTNFPVNEGVTASNASGIPPVLVGPADVPQFGGHETPS